MENIPDEVLMAYADDALAPAERRRVEAVLAADPVTARRLEPFIVTRTALPEIFSSQAMGPMPDRLIRTIRTAPIGTARADKPAGGGLLTSLQDLLFPGGSRSFAGALAMTCAVIAIAGGAWMVMDRGNEKKPEGPGQLIAQAGEKRFADGILRTALETAPMTETVKDEAGRTATPVLTFPDKAGRYCREFEIVLSETKAQAGFACRETDGAWIVQHASNFLPGETVVGGDEARPSGHPELPALERALDDIGASDAFGEKRESELLANGWKK